MLFNLHSTQCFFAVRFGTPRVLTRSLCTVPADIGSEASTAVQDAVASAWLPRGMSLVAGVFAGSPWTCSVPFTRHCKITRLRIKTWRTSQAEMFCSSQECGLEGAARSRGVCVHEQGNGGRDAGRGGPTKDTRSPTHAKWLTQILDLEPAQVNRASCGTGMWQTTSGNATWSTQPTGRLLGLPH